MTGSIELKWATAVSTTSVQGMRMVMQYSFFQEQQFLKRDDGIVF